MTTTSDAYQQFVKSLDISFNQWHDGEGYDLETLGRIKGQELKEVETILIENLEKGGGWRAIEALAQIGTPAARQAIRAALKNDDMDTRLRAAEQLVDMGENISLDQFIIEALRKGDLYEGASHAIDLAAEHPSAGIRKELLDLARTGSPEVRVHAAALSLYLAGHAEEPFDWNQRPFFLRFGEEDTKEVQSAHQELCEKVSKIPESKR